jgi:purine-binding chemotaxis protein CheW
MTTDTPDTPDTPDDDDAAARAARLAGLRADFDLSFASPPPEPPPPSVPLLLARAGDARLALRLDELAWVGPCPPLARVPGGRVGLVGLGVVRGRLVAVLDPAALAGSAGAAAQGATHVAVARADEGVALRVAVEGRAALDRAALPRTGEGVATVAIEGAPRELVSVAAIVRALDGRAEEGA